MRSAKWSVTDLFSIYSTAAFNGAMYSSSQVSIGMSLVLLKRTLLPEEPDVSDAYPVVILIDKHCVMVGVMTIVNQ